MVDMSQVAGVADQEKKATRRVTAGAKKPLVTFSKSIAASQIAAHAGTAWSAKIAMGRVVLSAIENGIKLTELRDELLALPFLELRAVKDAINLGGKTASGLSNIAGIARVLGGDIRSPDGKHVVTAAQVAAWSLSTDDAIKLARKLSAKKAEINVKTLAEYVRDNTGKGDRDGGKAAVRRALASNGTGGGKDKKHILVTPQTFAALKAKADLKGINLEELLKTLL